MSIIERKRVANYVAEYPGQQVVSGKLTGPLMAEAFTLIERHDIRVAKVMVSAATKARMDEALKDILNVNSIWGADVLVESVPNNRIYIIGEIVALGKDIACIELE